VSRAESRAQAPRWRAWSLQVALVGAAAGLLYLGLASWSDPGQVREVVGRFPPRAAAGVGGLVLAGLALRAARWHLYTRRLELGLPVGPSVTAFVAGFAFTATPGKVGEVVKSVLLRRRFGTSVSATAASLLVERVTDLLAMLGLAVVGLVAGGAGRQGAVGGSGWILFGGALAFAAALAFLLSARLERRVLGLLGRVRALDRLTRGLPPLLDASRRLLAPVPLIAGLALAVAAWSCEALALHVILDALWTDVPLAGSFFLFAAASLLGVLSMLPGGLGGFEATMVVLLGRFDVPSSTAVAATLLFRLGTLWLVSLAGLVVLLAWMSVYGRGERGGEAIPTEQAPGSR
jgi:uncharacterized protein (TIRG00374 family)